MTTPGKIILPLLMCLIITTGCVETKPMYVWGNYSETLYHLRKDATDEARDKHMAELEAIVTQSTTGDLRVPPGVYCELGYFHAQKGNGKQALDLFEREKALYPEATLFVDRLIQKVKTAGGANQESAEADGKKSGS